MNTTTKGVIGLRPSNVSTGSHSRPAVEAIEQRRLMSATTVTAWSDSTVSDLSGSCFGCIAFGDNGNADGIPTSAAGNGGDAQVWAYTGWDENLNDGLDSGLVAFKMGMNVAGDGSATLDVGGSGSETFGVGTSQSIHQVTIQAAVSGTQMQMIWGDLKVQFYSHGQLVDEVAVAGPTADTMSGTSGSAAESVVTVSTSASNYDGVCITGTVRLVAAQGTYPNPTDIFGQVVVS